MTLQELFNCPSKWTQHQLARDQYQRAVEPSDQQACSFCLTGAVLHCRPTNAIEVLDKIRTHIKCRIIWTWNDAKERTFEDVVALVKELEI